MNTPSRVLLLSLLLSPMVASANVSLPAIFSDRLVLQKDRPVPVWGWADPGEKVKVSIRGQTREAEANRSGEWKVTLSPLALGDATTLTIQGKNSLTIRDVLIGEVWLGSGQSNMAMTVGRSLDPEREQATARYPQIRMFKEESARAEKPQREGKGNWVVCSPETVAGFSATLYFFGREIHTSLGMPVGLINSSVGGTPIEAWIAPDIQRATPALQPFFSAAEKENSAIASAKAKKQYDTDYAEWKKVAEKARAEKQKAPRPPTNPAEVKARKADIGGLFNGKIAPLIPYAIRGALWYQGEANSTPVKAPYYQHQLPLLVSDWRKRWGEDFPFAWVQLPNYGGPGRDWPTVREAMLKTLALPKTGMAITIDVGDKQDIHPKNKQDVGRRLSLWALGTVYGKKVSAISGPLPAGHELRDREIALRFKHTDGGLVAKDGPLSGFVIAGADRQWKPAQARIEGTNVIVSSAEVTKPMAVRYAWENFPACNLYNSAGLPASPFRTDKW